MCIFLGIVAVIILGCGFFEHTMYVSGLEVLISDPLVPFPKFWNYRQVSPCLGFFCLSVCLFICFVLLLSIVLF